MKQTKRFRQVLRGMNGMVVWVHEIDRDAEKDGLSRQHLQDEVVVRLLDAGIKALGVAHVPEPPGNPWLNVFVNTVRGEGNYFFSVTVRLDEIVRPERSRTIKTIGTTWESYLCNVVEASKMPGAIERAMDELTDYFIYDYLSENSI